MTNSERRPANTAEASWSDLCARYDALSGSLAKLGGLLGTEHLADELLDELNQVVWAIAAHKAENERQIVRKLEIILTTVDESGDHAAATLIRSALADMVLVAKTA